MKPQMRPFSAITSEEIYRSAPHWAYVGEDGLRTISTRLLSLYDLPQHKPVITLSVYPCEFISETGIITPLPWPILPGEVEIEDFRNALAQDFYAERTTIYWVLTHRDGYRWGLGVESRPNMRPSPRRHINVDGTVTPVWVWEADR